MSTYIEHTVLIAREAIQGVHNTLCIGRDAECTVSNCAAIGDGIVNHNEGTVMFGTTLSVPAHLIGEEIFFVLHENRSKWPFVTQDDWSKIRRMLERGQL